MSKLYEDGWFYGYSPREVIEHDEGGARIRYVDSRNVVGRFKDHPVVDGVASREARRPVNKLVVILETRNLKTASETSSAGSDISVHRIRFDDEFYHESSIGLVVRFKEAWIEYLKVRKVPISDDEIAALRPLGLLEAVPEQKSQPKRRRNRGKKQNGGGHGHSQNVVKLPASA